MRFGVCSGFASFVRESGEAGKQVSWEDGVRDLPAHCGFLDQAGYDFIEFGVGITRPEDPESDFLPLARAMESSPLRAEAFNSFIPGSIKLAGPEADPDRAESYAAEAIRRMSMLGGKIVVFGSGGARKVPDGFPRDRASAQIVEFLRRVAPHAERRRMVVAVEPLNSSECNIINSVAEAMEYVAALDHPCVKVLSDLWHVMFDGQSFDETAEAGSDLRHVHVADSDRGIPGSGDFDFVGYFGALKRAGYRGRIAIECGIEDFRKETTAALPFLRDAWERASA